MEKSVTVRTPKKNPRFRKIESTDCDETENITFIASTPTNEQDVFSGEKSKEKVNENITPDLNKSIEKANTPQNDPEIANFIQELSTFSRESTGLKTPLRRFKTPKKIGSKSHSGSTKKIKSSTKKTTKSISPKKNAKRKLNLSPEEGLKKLLILSSPKSSNASGNISDVTDVTITEEEFDDDLMDSINQTLQNTQEKYNITKRNANSIVNELNKMDIMNNIRNAISSEISTKKSENCEFLYNALFQPKMTRAKFQEWLQGENGGNKLKQEAENSFINQILDDDEDTVYEPATDSHHSDEESDIESQNSLADFGSPFGEKKLQETNNENEVLFQNGNQIIDNQSKENTIIATRTRSKLPLNECNLDDLEASFLAPDVTPDLYDMSADNNPEWLQFLTNLTKNPKMDACNDEEEDEEFNAMKALDEIEEDKEEFRYDRAVKIPKSELSDLMAEIFNEVNDEDTQDGFIEEAIENMPVIEKSIENNNNVNSNENALKAKSIVSSLKAKDLIDIKKLLGNNLFNMQMQNLNLPSEKNKNNSVIIEKEYLKQATGITESHCCQLILQMEKHVQLLAQTYILSAGSENFSNLASQAKNLLIDLNVSSSNNLIDIQFKSISYLHPVNLEGALEICQKDTYLNVKHGVPSNNKLLSNQQVKTLMENKTFLYIELLPTGNFTVPKKSISSYTKKSYFSLPEDNLLALAISQTGNISLETCELISKYLMPGKNTRCIRDHLVTLASGRARHGNCVQKYLSNKEQPVFSQQAVCNAIQPPINQDLSNAPQWCLKYKKTRDNPNKSKNLKEKQIILPKITESEMLPRVIVCQKPVTNLKIISPTKTINTEMNAGFDILEACAAACGIDENVSMSSTNEGDNVNNVLNTANMQEIKSDNVNDILDLSQISPNKYDHVNNVLNSINQKQDNKNDHVNDILNTAEIQETNKDNIENKENNINDVCVRIEDPQTFDSVEIVGEDMPFLSSVVSLVINNKTPPKTNISKILSPNKLSPAKLVARKFLNKAKRKMLSVDKKKDDFYQIEEINCGETDVQQDIQEIQNLNSSSEPIKKVNTVRLKKDLIDQIQDDDLLENDPNKQQKNETFIQGLLKFIQVHTGNKKFREMIELCWKFENNKNHRCGNIVDFYKELTVIFSNYPTIVRLLSVLLLPDQALKCNCYEDFMFIQRFRLFMRKIFFENQPINRNKVIKCLQKYIQQQINETELHEKMTVLLKGQKCLLDLFDQLFKLMPIDYKNDDYEDINLDENVVMDKVDEFENLTCPIDEDLELNGTDKCKCSCHEKEMQNKFKHCMSCGLLTKKGKLYMKNNRKLEPVEIVYENMPSLERKSDPETSDDSVTSQIVEENGNLSLDAGDKNENNSEKESPSNVVINFSALSEQLHLSDSDQQNETDKSLEKSGDIDDIETQFSVPRADEIFNDKSDSNEKISCSSSQQQQEEDKQPFIPTETVIVDECNSDSIKEKKNDKKCWTREEDALLLQTCIETQNCSFRTFYQLSEKIVNKTAEEIAGRYQYISEMYQKMKQNSNS